MGENGNLKDKIIELNNLVADRTKEFSSLVRAKNSSED
jgi:hypothetical protein